MNRRKSLSAIKSGKGDFVSNLDINENINEEIEISSTTLRTLEIMRICRKRIIYPFNIMLMMIGWRPFGSQMYHSDQSQKYLNIINGVLLGILILLLLFAYVYQVITCRFVMNPEDNFTDVVMSSEPRNSTSWKVIRKAVSCNHIVTTYVIPNFIHFMAYIVGLIHYRFRKNEDIYGLMEKAMQYSTSLEQNKKSQYKVKTTLTSWMVLAVIWSILSVVNHIIYDVAYDTFKHPFYNLNVCQTDKDIEKWGTFLFILDFFGFIIISIVTTVVLLNYILYCELVKFYVNAINKKIEMRCIKLNVIKNDIQIISIAIDLINSTTGMMTTLIYFFNMSLLVRGLNMIFNKDVITPKILDLKLVFRIYFVIHLIPVVVVPLIQCVKLNNTITYFKDWAMHMSVFGYRKEKRKELDSFLLYTIGYKSKAKLLSLPLEKSHLNILCILIVFIFISLMQAGVLQNLRFIGNL